MNDVRNYRERIRIESAVHTPDDVGGTTDQWQCVQECFAEISPKSRVTQVTAGDLRDYQTHVEVRVRAPSPVTNLMRIIWRQRILMIDSIVPEPSSLLMHCREVRV